MIITVQFSNKSALQKTVMSSSSSSSALVQYCQCSQFNNIAEY